MSFVKVIRVPAEEGRTAPLEIFEGIMVDESGTPVDAPTLGLPLYLYIRTSRRKKKVAWTFRTSPIVEIHLNDPGFIEIFTNDGQHFSIDTGRVYH